MHAFEYSLRTGFPDDTLLFFFLPKIVVPHALLQNKYLLLTHCIIHSTRLFVLLSRIYNFHVYLQQIEPPEMKWHDRMAKRPTKKTLIEFRSVFTSALCRLESVAFLNIRKLWIDRVRRLFPSRQGGVILFGNPERFHFSAWVSTLSPLSPTTSLTIELNWAFCFLVVIAAYCYQLTRQFDEL